MTKIRKTPKTTSELHPSTAGLGLTPSVRRTVSGWCRGNQMDGVLYLSLEAGGLPFAQVLPSGTQPHLMTPRPRWHHYAAPYAWSNRERREARVQDLQEALDHLSAIAP